MPTAQLRHESNIAVYLMLKRGSKVLLVRRANTGYQDGKYSLVAGHVEGRESLTQALRREAKEEIGIKLSPKHIRLRHLMHRFSDDKKIYLDLFFSCSKWDGRIKNLEPHKCDDVSWHSLLKLPKNTIPYVREALQISAKKTNSVFRELGFK
jgi:8-oxo-dGTP diphosphatase